MPTTYSITLKCSDISNKSCGTGTAATYTINKSHFVVTGDTNRAIGKITQIVVKHYNSANVNCTLGLNAFLNYADGSRTSMGRVSTRFEADVPATTHTKTSGLPSAALWSTFQSVQVKCETANVSSAVLYYRATESLPFTIKISFTEAPIYYGVNGEWASCEMYYGVNGEWKQVAAFVGDSGEWVQA